MTMSRSGNTGNSPGICNCCSASLGSSASVASASMVFGILVNRSTWPRLTLLAISFGDGNFELGPSSVLNLRQIDKQHSVRQFCRRFLYVDRPVQRHDSIKMPIAALRTQVRDDSLPRAPLILLAADAQLAALQANLNLADADAR